MGKKYTYNEVKKIINDFGYELISKEYEGTNITNLVFKDNIGYYYCLKLNEILRANWDHAKFHKSNPYTIQNIKLWLTLNNESFELISEEYEGNNNFLILKDNYGYFYISRWSNLYVGHVPEKFHPSNSYTIQNIKLWLELNDNKYNLLSKNYKNSQQKIILKDKDGYFYTISLSNLVAGKSPSFVRNNNPYTIQNIKLWCKLNNLSIELVSNIYKGCFNKLKWKCLKCGKIFKRGWDSIHQGIILCPICSDNISYRNKFIYSFFNQLNEKYISEYSPDWAYVEYNNNPKLNGKKKYDIYLPNKKEIWEVHGGQHYIEGFGKNFKTARILEEEQENDIIKKELIEKNGLKYIVVDARKSNMEYIKNSLLNLLEIQRYDLSLIDWNKCHEFACNNLIKIACDLWCKGIKNPKDIGKIMQISRRTISNYLKMGNILDWCNYDSKEEYKNKRKIICLTTKEMYGRCF